MCASANRRRKYAIYWQTIGQKTLTNRSRVFSLAAHFDKRFPSTNVFLPLYNTTSSPISKTNMNGSPGASKEEMILPQKVKKVEGCDCPRSKGCARRLVEEVQRDNEGAEGDTDAKLKQLEDFRKQLQQHVTTELTAVRQQKAAVGVSPAADDDLPDLVVDMSVDRFDQPRLRYHSVKSAR